MYDSVPSAAPRWDLPSVVIDVYMRALERGICTGEMGLFGYQPGLGGIWVIPKGRPDGIEPVPPLSQMRQLTSSSGIISIP